MRRSGGRLGGVLSVALTIALAGSCAASSGRSKATPTAGSALCAALGRLNALQGPFPPEPYAQVVIFEREENADEAIIAEDAPADLSALLVRWAAENHVYSSQLLARWGTDGTVLQAQADASDYSSVFDLVLQNGLVGDGKTVTATQFFQDNFMADDQTALECDPVPSGWRQLVADPGYATPTGQIAFVFNSQSVGLTQLSANGAVGNIGVVHDSANDIEFLAYSPDGSHLVYQDGSTVWTSLSDGSQGRPISAAAQAWQCPAWSPDAKSLVVLRRLRPGAWVLSRYDLATGATTDLTAPVPLRASGCPVFLNSTTLLVAEPNPTTHDTQLYSMAADGGALRAYAAISGCSTGTPSVDGQKVLVATSCDDPYRDGLWLLAGDGGAPQQIFTGHVGAPAWTADGTDVLFGYQPLGQPTATTVLWAGSITGRTARPLTGLGAATVSWPSMPAG